MATAPEDQGKVFELGSSRPWSSSGSKASAVTPGPKVVSALGAL